jgi:hypothetical protein
MNSPAVITIPALLPFNPRARDEANSSKVMADFGERSVDPRTTQIDIESADTIAAILHYLHREGEDVGAVLRVATNQFIARTNGTA